MAEYQGVSETDPHQLRGCRTGKWSDLYTMKINTNNMKTAKSYEPASTAYFQLMTAEQRETCNIQARYYRDKANEMFNTASFEDLSDTVKEIEPNKTERLTAIQRAAKVRHNMPRNTYVATKYVMIGGVPHKMVNGNLVALTAKTAQ